MIAGRRDGRAGVAAPASATQTASASTSPGTRLWSAQFHGLGRFSQPQAMAPSPDGAAVFITGFTTVRSNHDRYATVGYNALTGAKLWRSIFHRGPALSNSIGQDVAVNPDSSKVFVTGSTPGGIGTVAYDAATGAKLWVVVTAAGEAGSDLAVSPDGGTLYVTGFGPGRLSYVTLAYSTASGALLWTSSYTGQLGFGDHIPQIVASPDGSAVFVRGDLGIPGRFVTIAYQAATGARLWARLFKGLGDSVSESMMVSPDGSTVFVTGDSFGRVSRAYATVAYAAATGARRWVRYDFGPAETLAHSLAVTPDGTAVFVTGEIAANGRSGYSTVAHDAATGAKLWRQRYFGPGGTGAFGWFAGVSPDGSTVYVTGFTSAGHFATLGYNPSTGAQLWSAVYRPAECASATGAVNPMTPEIMVTGTCGAPNNTQNYVTVAYSG